MDEVELAYSLDQLEIHAKIRVNVVSHFDENNNYLAEPIAKCCSTPRLAG
jgi:hypothetical protein